MGYPDHKDPLFPNSHFSIPSSFAPILPLSHQPSSSHPRPSTHREKNCYTIYWCKVVFQLFILEEYTRRHTNVHAPSLARRPFSTCKWTYSRSLVSESIFITPSALFLLRRWTDELTDRHTKISTTVISRNSCKPAGRCTSLFKHIP